MGVTTIRQPNQSEQALGAARSLFDRTRGGTKETIRASTWSWSDAVQAVCGVHLVNRQTHG